MSRSLPVLAALLSFPVAASAQAQSLPTPADFLKIPVGADRTLADYGQITAYFQELAKRSPRVQLEVLGKTTQGRDLLMAVISSEANLKAKARHQEIARRLADPRGLSQTDLDALVKEGKTILLVTCAIHSSEIGSTQMAMEWAHALASAQDAETRRRLDNVILLLVPSLNPDGHDMEVSWYRQNLGKPWEGGRMPWLYHWYVGHDNNRDWVTLTQKETQALTRAVYHTWNPQVWLDEHQMGTTGPRLFIPPFSNPVSPAIHPLVWRQVDAIGSHMGWRLEQAGKAGVGYGFSFDAYWPGGTKNTAWFKNTAGLLSEMASARLATPMDIHPSELTGMGKGLVDYKPQTNFPNPWQGGTWRLRDIMDYERILSDGLLEIAADRRADFLRAKVTMAKDSIALGAPERFWRIPATQHDGPTAAKLAHLLQAHRVDVLWSERERAWYVPSAQPFGRFVKEVLGTQRYPEIRLQEGAAPLAPYDVTAWSLPLHMGVDVQTATLPPETRKALRPARETDGPEGGLESGGTRYLLPRTSNAATPLLNAHFAAGGRAAVAQAPFEDRGTAYPAGTLILEPSAGLADLARQHRLHLKTLSASAHVEASPQKAVRVGLYKSYQASMDEGWTRFVLDQAGFHPQSLFNQDFKTGGLRERVDVLVLADQSREAILEGVSRRSPQAMPDDYLGGIGKEGQKALRAFVEAGGTLVCLGASGELAIEEFTLPVRNALSGRGTGEEAFNAPGTLVRIQVDPGHPVTWGMPEEAAAFLDGKLAFQTSPSRADVQRTVLASYPADARDILLSGYLKGAERLEHRSAAAAFQVGKGRVVLFGFAVQHRAQTDGTFKLLYNALLWGGLK